MDQENIVPNEEQQDQEINELRSIRVEKLRALQNAGKDPFEITTANQSIITSQIVENFEQLENTDVSICGRMMARRDMGKANFIEVAEIGRAHV